MKTNILHRTLTLCMGMIFCSAAIQAQTTYCEETLTGTGGNNISLSCYLVTDGQYEIKIEGENLEGLGGTHVYINNREVLFLQSKQEVSADKKTIIVPIASTTPPEPYTPLYVLMPGEDTFSWSYSINWTDECGNPNPDDTEAPENFTVEKGNVTHNSVELLLNATDNSGSVIYEIEYNGIKKEVKGISGTVKSYYVTELTPETAYTFSVKAKDSNNNVAANSPISISATTTVKTTNGCEGTDTEAQEGSFTNGYNYSFTTEGSDVIIEFEILENKEGLVAFAFTMNPNFQETQMTQVAGTNKFTTTYTGQTHGDVFKVACKFAFSGGLATTKYFDYIVGGDCTTNAVEEVAAENTAVFYPNPVQDKLTINAEERINEIAVYSLTGQKVKVLQAKGNTAEVDMQNLPSGNYLVRALLANGTVLTEKISKL